MDWMGSQQRDADCTCRHAIRAEFALCRICAHLAAPRCEFLELLKNDGEKTHVMGGHYFSYSTSPFVGRLRVDLIFRQTPIGAGTATLMQATSFVAAVGTSQGAKSAIDDDLCPPPMVPAIPSLPGFSLFPSPLRQNVASDHHPHAAEAGLGPQRDLEHDPTAASFLFLFRGRL